MNRIEQVLKIIGYTVDSLNEIIARCPGSYIEGLPKSEMNGCTMECSECWEAKDE